MLMETMTKTKRYNDVIPSASSISGGKAIRSMFPAANQPSLKRQSELPPRAIKKPRRYLDDLDEEYQPSESDDDEY